MSAIPPKADINRRRLDVRFVPSADIMQRSKVEDIQGVQRSLSVNLSPCKQNHAGSFNSAYPNGF